MHNSWVSFLPLVGGVFLIFALSACSTTPDTQVIRPSFNIPPQMLQCEEAGLRPSGKVIMESEVARYITSLEYANKDCKTRLKEISILVKCFNEPDCNVDKVAEYIGVVREQKQR